MCFHFPQKQIILQLLSIYSGLPKAFEILHCTSLTSEQDIRLFMKRVCKFRGKYVVLDVNILQFHLQEVIFMDLF